MMRNLTLRLAFTVLIAVSATFAQDSTGTVRYNQSGDRVIERFDVHAAELRSVLRKLSAYSGMDILASNTAQAIVSIAVTNKSWREVLAILCLMYDFVFVEESAFVYVMTQAEATARGIGRDEDGLMPPTLSDSVAPLVRQIIPLSYVAVSDIDGIISPFLTNRGKTSVVNHTNAIVIVDTEENIRQLHNIVKQIDIQVPQISISCKIIEVSSGSMQNMGISWGFFDGNNDRIISAGQFWQDSYNADGLRRYTADRHRATFSMLNNIDFQIALDYLFEDNSAELIAQPQITTLNNQEATIFMGQEVPINKLDQAGNTVTDMVSVGTQLTVTPYVAGEGKIMLTLIPSKESFTRTTDGPVINRQSASTSVLVNNGETVVIAGLTSNDVKNAETGIPFLKDIPILGHLFKRSVRSTEKKDLIIFVTPHIIHPDLAQSD